MVNRADIGVIGGSGFYSLLEDAEEIDVTTPYGPPSDSITVGRIGERTVAFIPRHGRGHTFPPHRIPYRANMWALRSLGVRQVLAPSAVGSLRPEIGPGALVIPDQLVDRTQGREQTYYDEGGAVHVSFSDPYCPSGRAAAVATARQTGWDTVDGGTLVVVQGPRFSTRAESQWFASAGWSIIGMTGHPEAVLARELALCYTTLALVTDHDAGVEAGEGVTHEEVLAFFAANVERMRALVAQVVEALPKERSCACGNALDGIKLPIELP
ncbi:purine nucleoside phosphorylase [Microbispora rosea subsp. aerata]|nr:S-methyl-5'-thioadenosine phosphorylase [Microbispora rosea]GGO30215.1 purine nucleoside phosphorylase [Microbispora rosea subsp. aerata]GIH59049.1 purine nucleoside phosphorylase [Microbispora rosea subsp. aerata]GLJ87375.1 purine nucleoside phosphorylase [Microbispora rosea subsp. aerata]